MPETLTSDKGSNTVLSGHHFKYRPPHQTTIVVMLLARPMSPRLAAQAKETKLETMAASPQETMLTRLVTKEDLDQENTALLTSSQPSDFAAPQPRVKSWSVFLFDQGPNLLRLLFSVFFGFLFVWTLLINLIKP